MKFGLDTKVDPLSFQPIEDKMKEANELSSERLQHRTEKLNLVKEKHEMLENYFNNHQQGKLFNLKAVLSGGKVNIFQGSSQNSWGKISSLGIRIHNASLRRSLQKNLPKIFERLHIIK